jgi:hypothetical protein
VSKVKVGRKPSVSHYVDYAGMPPHCLCGPRQRRKLFIARSHRCRISAATDPYWGATATGRTGRTKVAVRSGRVAMLSG